MQSDILILLKDAANEDDVKIISNAIYAGATTALVTFNSKSRKVFLVRFDPEIDTPQAILLAAKSIRADAVMAGG